MSGLRLLTCVAFLGAYPFFAVPAYPQQAGVGIGVGNANATSNAGNATSTATGGQGSVTFNQGSVPASTRSDSTLDQTITQRGGTVSRQTGSLRNAPATFAPGLTAAGLETCLGSVSGGISGMGFGGSFGTTVPDRGCSARLDARTLWSMGLKKASVARLCLTPEIQQSMPEVCAEYLPSQPAGAPGVYAPAPAVRAAQLEPVPYSGGRVMVIEKRTGLERPCDDYRNGRCLRWGR